LGLLFRDRVVPNMPVTTDIGSCLLVGFGFLLRDSLFHDENEQNRVALMMEFRQ